MSDTPPPDDHWRRLAADLGLDVGPEPEQPAAPPPMPEPPHRPFEPEPEAEPARGRRRRPEPVADAPAEPFGAGLEPSEFEEPAPRGRRGRPATPPDDNVGLFESEPVDAEVEGSDVEGAAVPESQLESGEEAFEEGIDEKTGKRRRRRRSRRKKKVGDPVPETVNGAESSEDRPVADPVAADDDDEEEPTAEVVRNWNVPSWDELIASLHRPER